MAGIIYAEDIKGKDNKFLVEGIFVLTNIALTPFKHKEGNFLTCTLSDKTGNVRGIVWENVDKLKACLQENTVVAIRGEVGRYNNVLQVIVFKVKSVNSYDSSEFIKSLSKEQLVKLKKQFIEIHKTIKNPNYKILWDKIGDWKTELSTKFWTCPGGKGEVHHAYVFGLAEHCVQMMYDSRLYICQYNLDSDLLLTGILVHDIGKIDSYTWDVSIEMSTRGRLEGHIAIGIQIVSELLDNLDRFDIERIKLLHMIASHHGDHGLIKPQFKEAVVLSCLDGANANINKVLLVEEAAEDGAWSNYDRLTDRYYYIDKHSQEDKEQSPDADNIGTKLDDLPV